MAATFKEIFGSAIPPKFTADMPQLPSPEDLKYKILIKTSVGKNTPRELIAITHLEGGGGETADTGAGKRERGEGGGEGGVSERER